MKKTTFALLLLILQYSIFNIQSYSQFSQVPLKLVNSSNAPLTGQAGNITFRKSPYSGGDVIGGLTVNEVGITGNYIAAGFTAYQQAKLYVSGTEQTWWGIQWTGDATTKFINASGTLAFAANQSMNGFRIIAVGDAISSTDALNRESGDVLYINALGTLAFEANQSMGGFRLTNVGDATSAADALNRESGDTRYLRHDINEETTHSTAWVGTFPQAYKYVSDIQTYNPPVSDYDLSPKKYVDDNAGVEPNTIIVDGSLFADVSGKKYRSISSAITYINASGSPGSANIWSIYVYPNKAGYYTDNFAWADYINIYGVGKVVIKNTLTYSLFVRTGLHTKNKTKDITWVQSDQTLFFNRMLLFNCAFVADSRGSDFGRLEIGSSTFRDCDIFFDYTDSYFTDDGGNRVMDCNFNTDMTAKFALSDKLYGWKFVTADAIDY